jgi:hypothetical protein
MALMRIAMARREWPANDILLRLLDCICLSPLLSASTMAVFCLWYIAICCLYDMYQVPPSRENETENERNTHGYIRGFLAIVSIHLHDMCR